MTVIQPNLYRTTFENGQPVMVTLNPYSNQLVENINKMMGDNLCYDTAMNPQLAKLTATLRKKQMAEPSGRMNMTENSSLQLTERQAGGCVLAGGRLVHRHRCLENGVCYSGGLEQGCGRSDNKQAHQRWHSMLAHMLVGSSDLVHRRDSG